jgi:maltose O-acetyltransferase
MLPFPAHNVSSRLWTAYVNSLAASSLLSRPQRARAYRSAGIEIHTDDIAPGCYFHSCEIRIGAGSTINHGVHFENVAPVTIGERCGLGIDTLVLTSHHPIAGPDQRYGPWSVRPVTIGDGCWIAARVTILPGVTIGPGCLVATGAVVTGDLEPHGLYGGVPARRIRDLDTEPRP